MKKAVVLSGHQISAWRDRYARGDAPAPLPYEVDSLARAGYDLDIRGISGGAAVTKVRLALEHRIGYSLQVPVRAIPTSFRADLVLALLDGEGVLPGLMKRRRLPPFAGRPLVVWSCWLADDIRRADPDRRAELKRQIEAVDLITHLSRHEVDIFTDLGIPTERLFPVTYGVSHRYYTPGNGARDIDVLAVGQDRGRDYATLFAAVSHTALHVDVVCRPENLHGLEIPDNVTVHSPVRHQEYRDLLRRTRVMAVPTRVMSYPTGSSVALEAASSGCCVVATRTPAMADYIRDGATGRLVPPADAGSWREVLLELRDDPAEVERLGAAARRGVEETFNAEHMWLELAQEIEKRGLV